jgi:hypothetical protein
MSVESEQCLTHYTQPAKTALFAGGPRSDVCGIAAKAIPPMK